MPNYKTHLTGGFITFILIVFVFTYILKQQNIIHLSLANATIFMLFCLFGSLFPDIDTKSKIQKYVYYPLFAAIIITILTKNWVFLSILSVLAFIPILVNHRQLTHKTWFVIFVPLLPVILSSSLSKTNSKELFIAYLFFVAGALSHLILDFGFFRVFKITRKRFKKRW